MGNSVLPGDNGSAAGVTGESVELLLIPLMLILFVLLLMLLLLRRDGFTFVLNAITSDNESELLVAATGAYIGVPISEELLLLLLLGAKGLCN